MFVYNSSAIDGKQIFKYFAFTQRQQNLPGPSGQGESIKSSGYCIVNGRFHEDPNSVTPYYGAHRAYSVNLLPSMLMRIAHRPSIADLPAIIADRTQLCVFFFQAKSFAKKHFHQDDFSKSLLQMPCELSLKELYSAQFPCISSAGEVQNVRSPDELGLQIIC